jgi:hypothetical protein
MFYLCLIFAIAVISTIVIYIVNWLWDSSDEYPAPVSNDVVSHYLKPFTWEEEGVWHVDPEVLTLKNSEESDEAFENKIKELKFWLNYDLAVGDVFVEESTMFEACTIVRIITKIKGEGIEYEITSNDEEPYIIESGNGYNKDMFLEELENGIIEYLGNIGV